MKKHVKLTIIGKVQGVWYRASTERKAKAFGVCGFVKNQPNGNVYAEAEGTDDQVSQLISWCKKGPPLARVEQVLVEEGQVVGFDDFEVRRGS